MKNQKIEIKLPVNYTTNDLLLSLRKHANCKIENFEIVRKSLDARKKGKIIWNLKIEINTNPIDFIKLSETVLDIEKKDREKHIIIVGSGPSGIFSGLVLLKAGYKVTLIE